MNSAFERLEAQRPPRRPTGPGPMIVLGLFALVPALALFGVYAYADGRPVDGDPAPPPPTTLAALESPQEPLPDGMLSFRRMPTVMSRDANADEFAAQLADFHPNLNERSCVAVSVDGHEIGARHANAAVIPASTQKLLVAAAALDVLGDDFTFRTTVLAPGSPVDGVIDGDIALVGSGDPVLASDWYPTSGLELRPVFHHTSLDTLADRIRQAGVTQINGSVLGDGSRYDDEFFAPGWGDGVAGLEAGPYDALLVNDALVLGDDRRADDPNAAAAREFTRLLGERGVTVAGEARAGAADSPESWNEIGTIESAPLTSIVEEMLTNSDNNTAELLVKEIGVEAGAPAGGTRQSGLEVIADRLTAWGVDTSNIVLDDGSGLSLANRLTCAALIAVLQRYEAAGTIGSALPVAAESGTLADLFGGHRVAGRLLGKTGSLNNPPADADPPAAKALAGYLPVAGGGAVEYALVLNGPTIADESEYRPVWDDFVDLLDTYPSGPTPEELGVNR